MEIRNKTLFYIGIALLSILIISYFIPITYSFNTNEITTTKLLGLLIFFQPMVLIMYILAALFLLYKGLGVKIKLV